MTRSYQTQIERHVTVIRGFRDVAQRRAARQSNVRQALLPSRKGRLVHRDFSWVLLRRIGGAEGLTTLCNSLEG